MVQPLVSYLESLVVIFALGPHLSSRNVGTFFGILPSQTAICDKINRKTTGTVSQIASSGERACVRPSAGHGIYGHLENTNAVTTDLISQLSTVETKEFGENLFTDYNSYFQYFLGIGLVP